MISRLNNTDIYGTKCSSLHPIPHPAKQRRQSTVPAETLTDSWSQLWTAAQVKTARHGNLIPLPLANRGHCSAPLGWKHLQNRDCALRVLTSSLAPSPGPGTPQASNVKGRMTFLQHECSVPSPGPEDAVLCCTLAQRQHQRSAESNIKAQGMQEAHLGKQVEEGEAHGRVAGAEEASQGSK